MTVRDQETSGREMLGMDAVRDPAVARSRALIRRDQLEAMRGSILAAVPVNMLLGLASTLVAYRSGHGEVGVLWYAVSTAANLLRIGLCRAPCLGLALTADTPPDMAEAAARSVSATRR